MRSHQEWAGVLTVLIFSAIPAKAVPATFFFTGHVNSEAINGCGVLVNCGVVTGSYTFDTATPDLNPDPTEGLYAVTNVTFSIDGVPFFSSTNGFITVANLPGVDQYGLLATGPAANGSTATLSMLLTDPTGAAFSSDALPANPSALTPLLPGVFQLNAVDDTFQLLGGIDAVLILPPGAGLVQVCKVAGAGIAVGTNFSFTVGATLITVAAGAAPLGSCGAPMVTPAGPVAILEAIPAGTLPTAIAALPNGSLVTSNVGAGTATVTVNAGGLSIVTFTDAAIANTAVLRVCKAAGAGTAIGVTFTFTVNGAKITVPAGSCSPLLAEPPGAVGIAESLQLGTVLTDITALPNPGLLVASNLAAGTATVTVSIGTQTTVTFTNATLNPFQVRYVSNLNLADSVINITNTGANGAPLDGPGFGPVGNICVNVYGFSPDEQLISCCSCLLTPNGLASLSVYESLRANTLTGVTPNSMAIKLLATGAGPGFTQTNCAGSAGAAGSAAFPLTAGMAAWATTAHIPGSGPVPAAAPPFAITETPFTQAQLSAGELASINNRCVNIIGNGSGFGICRSCKPGGLGAGRQ